MGTWDYTCEFFDHAIRKIRQEETENCYEFDFDEFITYLKKNGDKDYLIFMARQILYASLDDTDTDVFLDRVQEMIRDINGYERENACVIHHDPTGLTIKGDLPENVELKIQSRYKE